MAKICPKHVEATCFAALTGLVAMRDTIRAWVGTLVNDAFVGVTKDDLSKFWLLASIGFAMSFIPLIFLRLIPTKQEVDNLSKRIMESNSKEEKKASDIKRDIDPKDQYEEPLLL